MSKWHTATFAKKPRYVPSADALAREPELEVKVGHEQGVTRHPSLKPVVNRGGYAATNYGVLGYLHRPWGR